MPMAAAWWRSPEDSRGRWRAGAQQGPAETEATAEEGAVGELKSPCICVNEGGGLLRVGRACDAAWPGGMQDRWTSVLGPIAGAAQRSLVEMRREPQHRGVQRVVLLRPLSKRSRSAQVAANARAPLASGAVNASWRRWGLRARAAPQIQKVVMSCAVCLVTTQPEHPHHPSQ